MILMATDHSDSSEWPSTKSDRLHPAPIDGSCGWRSRSLRNEIASSMHAIASIG